jgi:peptidyl-prolyl cis-trans isomerase SurA
VVAASVLRDEVHVRHILIKPSEIRSEAATKELAEKLYDRISSGEDFATLAKSFSEDPGSALNGGDLNWVDPDSLVPEFREQMADAKQGVVTKPFRPSTAGTSWKCWAAAPPTAPKKPVSNKR